MDINFSQHFFQEFMIHVLGVMGSENGFDWTLSAWLGWLDFKRVALLEKSIEFIFFSFYIQQ